MELNEYITGKPVVPVPDILTRLRASIETWSRLGHPAIWERFIERNGVFAKGQPFTGSKRGTGGECFANASRRMWATSARYTEGVALRPSLGILIHHAWLVGPDNRVFDPTWDRPEECEYVGVSLDADVVGRQTAKTGYYCLFAPNGVYDLDFMLAIDPGLAQFIPSGRKTA